MAEAIYLLCALTSLGSAIALLWTFVQRFTRVLLFSAGARSWCSSWASSGTWSKTMYPFLNGVPACGSFVAGVLFFKFWRQASDRLLLYFVPRLLGFAAILIGVIGKNRKPFT